MRPPEPTDRLLTDISRRWAHAIRGTSYVSLNRRELRAYLDQLTRRLSAAVRAPELDHAAVQAVGADMVGNHFTAPESLERTLAVLGDEMTGSEAAIVRERATAVLAAFAAGYTGALRTRTLAEQQNITVAALEAQREAEDARRASEDRFRALFSDAAIGIVISTVQGEIVETNRAMCEMFGCTPEEIRRWVIADFAHPDDSERTWDIYTEMATGAREHARMEKPYYRSDGTTIWTDLVASLLRDRDGTPTYLVAMLTDTTERHKLHDRLRHQALHDPLTGLPNRTLFFERLDLALRGDRIGLCYLDLDGFKAINDTLGHDAGDRLLGALGARLSERLGGRHLVARMGGDEFVVLVEDWSGPDTPIAVAEATLAAVREPLRLGPRSVTTTTSIGVVDMAAAQTTAAELMKAADTTLYRAKAEGRNRWALFDPGWHAEEVTRLELSTSLRAALELGELFIEYQPLVRLRDEALIGVEALVRWQHPTLGRLGPDAFIGIAEQSGLISALGLTVLRTALLQARSWRERFPEHALMVSVNLAPHQVSDPLLVSDVQLLMAEIGVEPAQVQLEITESAIMASSGQPLETLHRLAALGLSVAIDDFGTGYSNLAYLRDLPVNSLKLAGPFVTRLHGGDPTDQDRTIVGAMIGLAHALGLTVTAEEVETAEQVATLRALGCDTAQGYYYAEPGPPEAIDKWLGTGRGKH